MKATELRTGDCFKWKGNAYFVPKDYGGLRYSNKVPVIDIKGEWEDIPFNDEIELVTAKTTFRVQNRKSIHPSFEELPFGAWFNLKTKIYIKIDNALVLCVYSDNTKEEWMFSTIVQGTIVERKTAYQLDFSEIEEIKF